MRTNVAAYRFILNAHETVRILEGGIPDARLPRPWTADQPLVPLGADTVDPPHIVIASDGSLGPRTGSGEGASVFFDPVLGTVQLQLNGRVALLRCTSSLELEPHAILMALAAVPCNSPVTIWCVNLGAVTWLRNTEQLRAGDRCRAVMRGHSTRRCATSVMRRSTTATG